MKNDKNNKPMFKCPSNIPCKVRLDYSNVDHPLHYNFGRIEVIDVIEDWNLGFHLGNAVKYIARSGKKMGSINDIYADEIDDLRKALWYMKRYLDIKEKEFIRRNTEVVNSERTSSSRTC